jgi:hypothetical protein
MRKISMPVIAMLVIGANLLVACGQSSAPTADPVAPAVATSAPVATSAQPAAPATAVPQPADANPVSPAAGNCSQPTKDEVGKILAEAVVEVRDPAKDGSLCVYQTQNLILELNTQHNFGGFADSVNFMKQLRANFTESGDTPLEVPGLGDEAFYHGAPDFIRSLLVRKGDTVYSFGLRNITADQSLSSPANVEELEKSLAELVLSRLQ